jgi:predicted alpha/beta hydrolase
MSTSKPAVVIESIRLVARDGPPLSALRYSAPGAVRGHVVVAGARGLGPIGHMGYFRRAARPLWDDVVDWFGGIG